MKTVTEAQVGKVYKQNSGNVKSELCMGCGEKLNVNDNGYHKDCDNKSMWK